MGAQGVGVLLLALPVQCQGAGAGSHPGREVQEADGAGTTLRTPSPLPTELPQGSTVLGAHLRCHLHWVPPPCPALLLAWGVWPLWEPELGVLELRGNSPWFPWQPPGAHVQSGDFSRSRWSCKE